MFLVVVISFSCSQKKEDKLEDGAVKIDMNTKSNKKFKDLVAENFFIKLEATNKSNLRYISDVQITKEYIFIGDVGAQGIFIFSFPDGKFVREINHLGSGPEEYLGLNDFEIDEKSETIEILDSNNKNIIKYDFNGKYICSNKKSITGAMEFLTLQNGKKIISGILNEDNDKEKYEVFEMDKNLIDNKFIEVKKEFGFLSKSFHNLTKCNKGIYYNPLYSPIIYQLNENEMKMKYFVDFGSNWIDNKVMYDNDNPDSFDKAIDKNHFVRSLNPVIGDDFLTISYYLNKKNHFCLYNIHSDKIYYVKDFVEGILLGNGYQYFSDGYFISVKDPIGIIEASKKMRFDPILVNDKFISDLNINDNHVLMFTKFIDKFQK